MTLATRIPALNCRRRRFTSQADEFPRIRGYRGGVIKYRCLTGKCYANLEAMRLKMISAEDQLAWFRERYRNRGYEGKQRMLNEVCEHCG
jgi:hypothetical protein